MNVSRACDDTKSDRSTCFEILTEIGLQKDEIQSYIKILRESRQQIPKESDNNQKIQIILQNVVQLDQKSNNFGNSKDFTIQNTYQGIDTETFKARIQDLQESIHKILLEKNNIDTQGNVDSFEGNEKAVAEGNIPIIQNVRQYKEKSMNFGQASNFTIRND